VPQIRLTGKTAALHFLLKHLGFLFIEPELNVNIAFPHIFIASLFSSFLKGLEPQDAPPPDYYAMMRELHGIGNNLNQIAVKAHTLNALDVQRYDENSSCSVSSRSA